MKFFPFRQNSTLALFLVIVASSLLRCVPLFAAAQIAMQYQDSVVAGIRPKTEKTRWQKEREYAQNHLITRSDTISVFVTRVVDGDTFMAVTCLTCGDSIRVRVLGIDTYESKNYAPRKVKKQVEAVRKQTGDSTISQKDIFYAGDLAKRQAEQFLLHAQVKLHRGTPQNNDNLDPYNRPLRYVTLSDGQDFAAVMRQYNHNAPRK